MARVYEAFQKLVGQEPEVGEFLSGYHFHPIKPDGAENLLKLPELAEPELAFSEVKYANEALRLVVEPPALPQALQEQPEGDFNQPGATHFDASRDDHFDERLADQFDAEFAAQPEDPSEELPGFDLVAEPAPAAEAAPTTVGASDVEASEISVTEAGAAPLEPPTDEAVPPSEVQVALPAEPQTVDAEAAVEPDAPVTEEPGNQFSQLSQIVLRAASTRQLQVLALCGVARGDGASFVARNLSLALAEQGHRVGYLEAAAGSDPEAVEGQEPGAAFRIALRRTSHPAMSEITTPQGRLTLAQLVAGCDIPAMIGMLRSRFDFVLMDVPAALSDDQVPAFAALTDGVILVAQQNDARRSPVNLARTKLQNAQARVLGVVLNHQRGMCSEPVRQVA